MSGNDPDSVHDAAWFARNGGVKAQQVKEEEIFARELDADVAMMRWLVGDERGKRFLAQLLIRDGGVLTRSYVGGVAGDRDTALREGARGLALQQLDKLTAADPRGFVKVSEYQIAQDELLARERANVS
jgi:hypothetical protein